MDFPLSAFFKNANGVHGVGAYCKPCFNARANTRKRAKLIAQHGAMPSAIKSAEIATVLERGCLVCIKCGAKKPLPDFVKNSGNGSSLPYNRTCKACNAELLVERRKRHAISAAPILAGK